jgi:flagellar protein FliO/FliZ
MICRLLLVAGLLLSQYGFADDANRSQLAAEQEVPNVITQAVESVATEPAKTTAPAHGATPARASVVGSSVVTADPFAVVFGLLFIIALSRMNSVSMVSGQLMKIVAAQSVGPREKILLVDVAGQQILLGVAPGHISHLQSFAQPVITVSHSRGQDFSSKLKQLLSAKNSSTEQD